jgi:hypothetical protein
MNSRLDSSLQPCDSQFLQNLAQTFNGMDGAFARSGFRDVGRMRDIAGAHILKMTTQAQIPPVMTELSRGHAQPLCQFCFS